jgi:hypothetical protein
MLKSKVTKKIKKDEVPSESIVAIDAIPEKEINIAEEAYMEVTQTVVGREDKEAKVLKIKPFVTTPARVEVHAKRHIPLGMSVGNLTVAVTVSVPCYKEEIISVYKQTDTLVDKMLKLKVDKILSELDA